MIPLLIHVADYQNTGMGGELSSQTLQSSQHRNAQIETLLHHVGDIRFHVFLYTTAR